MDERLRNKSDEDDERRFSVLVIGCTVVAFGLTAIILTVYFQNFSDGFGDQNNFAQFGDYVGGILNPAVAFCALMALLFGIRQQRKELKETRKQFGEQAMESMFFQMLQLHNDMVSSIDSDVELAVGYDFHSSGPEAETIKKAKLGRGREIFRVMYDALRVSHIGKEYEKATQDVINQVYESVFQPCQSHLGHYFRYLYNIFQFIHGADIRDDKKRLYGKLVRAQLSNHELAVLYYNCLSDLGSEKFKPLAEEYCLFKNLPSNLLLKPDHYSLYEPEAWGSNYKSVRQACTSQSN